MASAASATSSSGSFLNSSTTQNNNGLVRTTMRSSSNAKGADAGRKQSPVEGLSRRPSSHKAWGSASSSASQRAPMASQQNGSSLQPRNQGNARSGTKKESGVSDKQAHERLMFLFGAAIGLTIVITVKSGDSYEGLLSGSTFNPSNSKVTLKMVRKLPAAVGGQTNGAASREAALIGSSPEHAMNFDVKDMADMYIAEFSLPENPKLANGSSTGFQTDADISGNQLRGERTLQRWVPEEAPSTDFSLESGNATSWDQFATNSQLFGTQSTYDENLYTTSIDRSAPSYRRREAEAERLAREIEGSAANNMHIREERGQALENDGDDEEEKYSGVRREERGFPSLPAGGPNKYTPPARRAPTGQATVPGVPVDPAIISAQLHPLEGQEPASEKQKEDKAAGSSSEESAGDAGQASAQTSETVTADAPLHGATSAANVQNVGGEPAGPKKAVSPGPTENVEVKVLNQFRVFADTEKQRVMERRKAQQNQDRTAKLNELLRFSKTFKLKTPIPNDLIGILAKDPAKQEAIVEKAQKEHEESASTAASPSPAPAAENTVRKVEDPQPIPSVPDRQTFNRGRGGFPQPGRSDRATSQQQTPLLTGRNNNAPYQPRFPSHQDRKGSHAGPPIPAPIPIIEGRVPPTGPMADQNGMISPQRSNMHTPTSAISGRFNLNVKASEFRPTAATFNPGGSSQTPSSPASTQRGGSISRTASPSLFFGNRKPKPASERPSITKDFNPITRMKEERSHKKTDPEGKHEEPHKDYSSNGGIPNAFQTGPRWTVKAENDQKTYEEAFEQLTATAVPRAPARLGSNQHIAFAGQGQTIPSGPASIPHIATPQHGQHAGVHQYPHQYDDGNHRLQFGAGTPGVYPSPSVTSRQTSTYASPMPHPAQLAYPQQPYFGTPGGQMQMQMRPFPGTPGMMHAQIGQMGAPMMVQQPSNGPYMAVPQQFNPQMQMYSPNSRHAYPQQNGAFSSPGQIAPMMMQQGSQQSHTGAPNMMFSVSNQGVPMGYPQQQMGMPRGNYGGHQYGSNAQQGYGMQHRTMSGGYGQIPQKMHSQMQVNNGPAMNGPPQGPAYGQMESAQDDGK
ncbi:hypothetical protein EDD37DRAFT_96854 [Exophiala viscosa]|uniref:uncharacterized protein n=1 Tax=Exophiala viscosa TaxID=2486360 RepID=UPI00218EA1EE|nr:hypothetical protein EDD37DRAFT_96854 [Exophiala viscosa]